ncbi:MAG: hypothetical protein SVY53_11745 [Chloroflexota bacterium]|nr:hypothetical protein [Chloroflexota bacterium]
MQDIQKQYKLADISVVTPMTSKTPFICFLGTYSPIMCGIADYTQYVTRELSPGRWGIICFNPGLQKVPQTNNLLSSRDNIWYGLPDSDHLSQEVIGEGLNKLYGNERDCLLWFQHEFGLWPNMQQFVSAMRELDIPKIVTLHTLHFQSQETPSGLRAIEDQLLRSLLPHVDAITVFSHGVYSAVITSFPEYHDKVHIIRHGIHSYPEIKRLTREEAKEKLLDFLLYESNLDYAAKKTLHEQLIFQDQGSIIIGQTGFLDPAKRFEILYHVRDELAKTLPQKHISAVRIGNQREETQKHYTSSLRREHNGVDKFFLETWLPPHMLPVAQRAFDINLYWPDDCTQSGILAHALGAGALIAGRDLEGAGETLKEASAPVATTLERLIDRMREIILNPHLTVHLEDQATAYASRFSWTNQAVRHYELAEQIVHSNLHDTEIQYHPLSLTHLSL